LREDTLFAKVKKKVVEVMISICNGYCLRSVISKYCITAGRKEDPIYALFQIIQGGMNHENDLALVLVLPLQAFAGDLER
jgi:hypothetical protein